MHMTEQMHETTLCGRMSFTLVHGHQMTLSMWMQLLRMLSQPCFLDHTCEHWLQPASNSEVCLARTSVEFPCVSGSTVPSCLRPCPSESRCPVSSGYMQDAGGHILI